jgi:5,10-methylenetetrahydrofolate reductase
MGRIIESIKQAYAEGKTTVSFEFFPAKTEEGIDNLLQRIEVQSSLSAHASLRRLFASEHNSMLIIAFLLLSHRTWGMLSGQHL